MACWNCRVLHILALFDPLTGGNFSILHAETKKRIGLKGKFQGQHIWQCGHLMLGKVNHFNDSVEDEPEVSSQRCRDPPKCLVPVLVI